MFYNLFEVRDTTAMGRAKDNRIRVTRKRTGKKGSKSKCRGKNEIKMKYLPMPIMNTCSRFVAKGRKVKSVVGPFFDEKKKKINKNRERTQSSAGKTTNPLGTGRVRVGLNTTTLKQFFVTVCEHK